MKAEIIARLNPGEGADQMVRMTIDIGMVMQDTLEDLGHVLQTDWNGVLETGIGAINFIAAHDCRFWVERDGALMPCSISPGAMARPRTQRPSPAVPIFRTASPTVWQRLGRWLKGLLPSFNPSSKDRAAGAIG